MDSEKWITTFKGTLILMWVSLKMTSLVVVELKRIKKFMYTTANGKMAKRMDMGL